MSKLFKKLFIKNYQDTANPTVRASYGTAAGVLGILANIVLFACKLVIGILSGSVAVVADAINNLTDFMTSIVTLIGFRLSSRPADKEHPYGHSRIEHVTALIVAFIILYIGIEVGRTSIDKIINFSPTDFSYLTIAVLAFAIIVKLALSFIFKDLGKSINSDALFAMSTDSRNDVISTSVVLLSAIIAMITDLSLDGYLGVLVAVFIIVSSIKLIKETIDPLLGTPPEKDLVIKVEEKIKSYPQILGIHDLVIHKYGPLKTFASVHIEVSSTDDIMDSHDLADNVERDFFNELGISLVCHLDPIAINDPETTAMKEHVYETLRKLDKNLSMHDFRVVHGKNHTNLIFDVVLPFDVKYTELDIKNLIREDLKNFDKQYYAVIEFDRDFNQ